ncbi:MAG: ArsI/CadI family heavy metal resistance metalloenzyme [Acidimicrobiia bacterium]
MARVQLALNVADLDTAIDFYSRLFDTAPAKVQPGYANFAIADPPLKLVLFEGAAPGTINHLGVEVTTSEEVTATNARLNEQGVDTATEDQVDCCFALQDKTWIEAPDAVRWEIYTVLEDTQPTADAAPCCT